MTTASRQVDVEVVDESKTGNDSPSEKIQRRMSAELSVLSKAASIYFGKYSDLLKKSEAKENGGLLLDLFSNSQKAHKAAWKYIVENSEVHKDNEERAEKYLSSSSIQSLHKWLADID